MLRVGEALATCAARSTVAGGVSASRVASWNGTTWSALGTGISGVNNTPYAMAEYDDGNGPALFVGGEFNFADGKPSFSIAKWGCSRYQAIDPGLAGTAGVPVLSAAGEFAEDETPVLEPLPSGLDVYVQTWIQDPVGPVDFATSNAAGFVTD